MSKNPFDDDYRSSSIPYSSNLKSYSQPSNTIEDEADFYEREIERYMQESLDSTERSRQHLANSEKVGLQTADNLILQREKLDRTEKNLDNIHATTQMTQRNLNSLKSVVGGFFKNKFSKKPKEAPVAGAEVPQSKSTSNLAAVAANMGGTTYSSGPSGMSTLSDSSRNAIKGTRWEAMDNQIDENLDAMSTNLRQLKSLGDALGREVDEQNQMLDRIDSKALRNRDVIDSQDKQMQQLLGGFDKKQEQSSSSMTPSMDASTKMSLAMKATSLFK